MAKESNIVTIINTRLDNALQGVQFNGKQIKGIVYSVVYNTDGNEIISFPLNGDEGTDIKFNDTAPIQIHHRHLSNTVTIAPGGIVSDSADMRLYITALRSRIGISNDSIKDYICSQLLYDLTSAERQALNIRTGSVQFTGADMNSIRLFQQEYGNPLTRTDIIMIEVQYKIECRYTMACINDLCYDD